MSAGEGEAYGRRVNPLMIVISGPSGVGKDAVVKRMQQRAPGNLHFVVTANSRPQRPGEVEGRDYFFVTREQFRQMIEAGELLEHAIVYGDYKGIPKQQVRDAMASGRDIIMRVDVQGAATIRTILPDAVFIFLMAESEQALFERLRQRNTDNEAQLASRIDAARQEITRIGEFDYVVVNAAGRLDEAVDTLFAILVAEKCKVVQREVIL